MSLYRFHMSLLKFYNFVSLFPEGIQNVYGSHSELREIYSFYGENWREADVYS